ncbi:NACHT, LRR and PYD domains-containing protein 6 isoform X2 [Mus pahari]|uniref:NACHT, LRR and PYD domains-containing protein 6 isoform X2 n=1 Tax=Mus pahari TaxID=10093 RepID=UPI000A3105A3|nr:NACHT, LRR and PYD domains-containing protein 6 isoform X2 [Mus pahari]
MDAAGASCSSSADAVARELLMAALQELTQEQLKRFRHKLRDAPLDGRSIPWGRLERSDALDLVDKLIEFYEPVPAVEMTRQVLKRSDIRDVALKLKEQQLQKFGPSSVLLFVSEFKKKYREHVLRQHAKVKERNARSVKINKRFTKLLIAPGTGAVENELLGPSGEPEPERARRSDTHTFNRLFRGNEEEGSHPLTVVLQGPAGIGKTMAAKKILYDWAAGKLYHSQVDFAFFIPCGELLERPGTRSLADLVLDQCPDRSWPVRRILAQPSRLLFILDGVDELPTLASSEATPCKDPFEATSGLRVLSGLLSQELLPSARLLVTTRNATTGRLQGRLCSPQCAEIRGFSDKDKKKYFFKFFRDERKAERAYRFVKENETLFALCFVPFVCWIVCTVLQQQLELGRDLSRTSKTTTSVYLLFITSMLKSAGTNGPRVQGELRTLCRLAREGILDHHKAQFSEEDLEKLKLRGSQVQTIFLNKKELPGVLKNEVTYQFIDQSFQEFLAALSYLLEAERTPGTPAGGVQKLLNSNAELHGPLALTTRFLFGLLNTEGIRDIGNHFGCVVPDHVKKDTLQWVQGQSHPKGPPGGAKKNAELEDIKEAEEEEEEEEEEEDLNFGLELLYCLYETQEEDFVRQALSSLPEMVLERVRLTRMDLEVLNYCVQCCPDGQTLRLVSCGLVAAKEKKKKKSLVKRLKGSQSTKKKPPASLLRPLCETMITPQCHLSVLILSHCKLPDAVCRDLSEALKVAPALRELGLLQSQLTDTGLRLLCQGLAWPKCQVKTLRMQLPGLQEVINYLVIVLQQSTALTTLDLSGCQLPGVMVEPLCSALKHPKCCLKTLSLTSVELSENSLRELQGVKTSKPDLSIIYSK